jgi:hypothetical protein
MTAVTTCGQVGRGWKTAATGFNAGGAGRNHAAGGGGGDGTPMELGGEGREISSGGDALSPEAESAAGLVATSAPVLTVCSVGPLECLAGMWRTLTT